MQPGPLTLLLTPSPEPVGVPSAGPVPKGPTAQRQEAGAAPSFAVLLGLLRRVLPGEGAGGAPEAAPGALPPGLLPGDAQARLEASGPEDGSGAGLALPAAELLQRLLQALGPEGGGVSGEVPADSGPAGSEGGSPGPGSPQLQALRAWLTAALAISSRGGPPSATGEAAASLAAEDAGGAGAVPDPRAAPQLTPSQDSPALDPAQVRELERLLRRLGLAASGTPTGDPPPPLATGVGRPPAAASAQPAPPLLPAASEVPHPAAPLGVAPAGGASGPAAALPQAPPLELPARHPAWGTELGQRVLWMVRQEVQAAEIRLHPPHLGPLEARVSLVHDQVSVTFVAQHAQAREALDAALPRLREFLGDHGLQLADASVAEQGLADRGREGPGGSGQAGARDGAMEGEGGAGSLREAEGPAQAGRAGEAAGWRPRLVDRYV